MCEYKIVSSSFNWEAYDHTFSSIWLLTHNEKDLCVIWDYNAKYNNVTPFGRSRCSNIHFCRFPISHEITIF
jgi:hypothetical protein